MQCPLVIMIPLFPKFILLDVDFSNNAKMHSSFNKAILQKIYQQESGSRILERKHKLMKRDGTNMDMYYCNKKGLQSAAYSR